jgi:pyruvate dehydrogenase E1 component alpha subunit
MEPNKLLDLYTRILRIRRFEEQVGTLFAQGQLPGFVHLYIGEEAVGAGICALLRDDDTAATATCWPREAICSA